MNEQSFSLFHQMALPKRGLTVKPPLLLMLHGFGANENDLFSLAPYLDNRCLIVSARAPVQLAPGSFAWFRLGFTPEKAIINAEEAESSRQTLRKFVAEVVSAYQCDPNAIYLMGFSQGGMMSLTLALTFPGIAAGVVSMSGMLLPESLAQVSMNRALIGLPIFVSHGTLDTVLPIERGRETRDHLSEMPIDLTYREYTMAHEVSGQCLRDIINWLKERLDGYFESEVKDEAY